MSKYAIAVIVLTPVCVALLRFLVWIHNGSNKHFSGEKKENIRIGITVATGVTTGVLMLMDLIALGILIFN